jgi:hypothetical protein
MVTWSNHEPRLTAAKMPAGMPRTVGEQHGDKRQFHVAGNSERNSC